jgi:hypothetical protein
MPRRSLVRSALALAIVLALVLGGLVALVTGRIAVASPVGTASGDTLYETASAPFNFDNRSYNNLPMGVKMNVTFFDADSASPHTFTLLNISNFWISNWSSFSSAYLGTLVHKHGALFNISVNPVTTGYASFLTPSTMGYYEFVCMEPGHLQEGMWGIIAFGEPVPSNISLGGGTPGAGLAVFIIVGTIVTLTVLAIVLGFVVGKRRGSELEMPPERLGYPEPSAGPPAPPPSPAPGGPGAKPPKPPG